MQVPLLCIDAHVQDINYQYGSQNPTNSANDNIKWILGALRVSVHRPLKNPEEKNYPD